LVCRSWLFLDNYTINHTDALAAVSHIYTFEVATTDGDIKHVLSTKAKIKEFPLFDEVITVNDVNAEIVWLSDEDETLYEIAAHAFHNK
jgi:hypothetical protein